jgi:hypothetical protein
LCFHELLCRSSSRGDPEDDKHGSGPDDKTAMRLLGKQGREPATLSLEEVAADDEEDEQPEDPQPDRDPGEN